MTLLALLITCLLISVAQAANPQYPAQFSCTCHRETEDRHGKIKKDAPYNLWFDSVNDREAQDGIQAAYLGKNVTVIRNKDFGLANVIEFFDTTNCNYNARSVHVSRMEVPKEAKMSHTATVEGVDCDVYVIKYGFGLKTSSFYVSQTDNSLRMTEDHEAISGETDRVIYRDVVVGQPDERHFQINGGCYKMNGVSDDLEFGLLPGTEDHLMVNDPRRIYEANKKADTWTAVAYPQFEGKTMGEIRQMLGWKGARNLPVRRSTRSNLSAASDLAHFDSAEQWPQCAGLINGIHNQGSCGSCWAFGAAESISDRFCIATNGTHQDFLNPQYLVSCDPRDRGCNGGFVDFVHFFLHENGIPSSKCSAGCGETSCKLHKYSEVYTPGWEEEAIKAELLAHGPVEVAFYVFSDFMSYGGGIYKRTSNSMQGGHAVKLVGWGEEKGVKYWKIANSWGSGWGEKGFFRIRRGTNECGIESEVGTGLPQL